MMLCRTLADVEAAADADSAGDPPLSQDAADRVAAILTAARGRRYADRDVVAVLEELAGPIFTP